MVNKVENYTADIKNEEEDNQEGKEMRDEIYSALRERFSFEQKNNPKPEDSEIDPDDLWWEDLMLYEKHLNFVYSALKNIKDAEKYANLCADENSELDRMKEEVENNKSLTDKEAQSRVSFYARLRKELLDVKYKIRHKTLKEAA